MFIGINVLWITGCSSNPDAKMSNLNFAEKACGMDYTIINGNFHSQYEENVYNDTTLSEPQKAMFISLYKQCINKVLGIRSKE